MKAFAQRVVEARWFEPWMIGTFVMLNLFIAVVINNLEASKAAELEDLREPVTYEEVLRELERTRNALTRLQHKLEALAVFRPVSR